MIVIGFIVVRLPLLRAVVVPTNVRGSCTRGVAVVVVVVGVVCVVCVYVRVHVVVVIDRCCCGRPYNLKLHQVEEWWVVRLRDIMLSPHTKSGHTSSIRAKSPIAVGGV